MDKKPKNHRELGSLGETRAAEAYVSRGFCVILRNWHFHRMGEIDLILRGPAENGETVLVFCEVKMRKNRNLGPASLAVNGQKQMRIRALARCFLGIHPEYCGVNVRFDVAEVYAGEGNHVDILENAF